MSQDEYAALLSAVGQAWPSEQADAQEWFESLRAFDAGHVTAALVSLQGSVRRPSLPDVRAAAARCEIAARPSADDGAHPLVTLREWRASGCPGIEAYGLDAAVAETVVTGDAGRAMP